MVVARATASSPRREGTVLSFSSHLRHLMRQTVYGLVTKLSSRSRVVVTVCTVDLTAPASLQYNAKRTESLAERSVETKYFW